MKKLFFLLLIELGLNSMGLYSTHGQTNRASIDSKFRPIFEYYLRYHFEGWRHEKYYTPNTVGTISIISRDKLGKPTKIRANCDFNLAGGKNQWIEILLENEKVYGIIFYDYPYTILIPTVDHLNREPSQSELNEMYNLQHKYLYNKIRQEQSQFKANIDIEGCSKAEVEYVYEQTYRDEGVYDSNGKIVGVDKVEDGKKIKSQVRRIINGCDKTFRFFGIERRFEENSISYISVIETVPPGGDMAIFNKNAVNAVNIKEYYDFKNAKYGEMYYFLKHNPNISNEKIDFYSTINFNSPLLDKKLTIELKANGNKIKVISGYSLTNIKLKKGDIIDLHASGVVEVGFFAGNTEPSGINGYTGYNKVNGFKHGSLLGKIGAGEWFFIGNDKTFIADRDGPLHLIINDSSIEDNKGNFIVEFSINNTKNSPTPLYNVPNEAAEAEKKRNNELISIDQQLNKFYNDLSKKKELLKRENSKQYKSKMSVSQYEFEITNLEDNIKFLQIQRNRLTGSNSTPQQYQKLSEPNSSQLTQAEKDAAWKAYQAEAERLKGLNIGTTSSNPNGKKYNPNYGRKPTYPTKKNAKEEDSKLALRGGLNLANLKYQGESSDILLGYHLGVMFNIPFSKTFSLQPELSYTIKGAKDNTTKDELKLPMIELPVLLKCRFGGSSTKFFVNGGGYGAYVLSTDKVKPSSTTIEYGVVGGLGIEFPAGDGKLLIEGRYNYGLGYTNKDFFNSTDYHTTVIGISLGYFY